MQSNLACQNLIPILPDPIEEQWLGEALSTVDDRTEGPAPWENAGSHPFKKIVFLVASNQMPCWPVLCKAPALERTEATVDNVARHDGVVRPPGLEMRCNCL